MSLLHESMTDCTLLERRTEKDGVGGYIQTYVEGVDFRAAITIDQSTEARVAEKQGVLNLYTVTTRKAMNLEYHDVFRRDYDGKIFRVTSDGDDNKTPESASIDMRQVTAEEYTLPNFTATGA